MIIEINKSCNSISERRNALLLALFFLEKEIIQALETRIKIPYVSFFVMLFIIAALFVSNRKYNLRRSIVPGIFLGIVSLFIFVSILLNGYASLEQYFKQFITFGIITWFFFLINIDYSYLFSYLVKLSAIFSVLYLLVFRKGYANQSDVVYGSTQMAIAYNFLPIAIVAMTYLLYSKALGRRIIDVLCASLAYLISVYAICFDCFSRGAIVGLVLSAFALMISKIGSIKGTIILIVGCIAALIIVANLDLILIAADNALSKSGVDIPALSRAISLLRENNLNSGRSELYKSGLDLFLKSPIIGNGVGLFENIYGMYVHNIIIELLFECGIVGTAIIVWRMAMSLYYDFIVIKHDDDNQVFFRRVLALSSILPLVFSSSLWLNTLIWLYFVYIFSEDYSDKHNVFCIKMSKKVIFK